MSETRDKLNLDAALREWPDAEKPASDWEERARSIEARVASGAPATSLASVSDENLFAAPLGQIEGEGHNSAAPVLSLSSTTGSTKPGASATRPAEEKPMTMPADRERDRRSLQDLAKMAQGGLLTPPPPSVRAPSSSAPSGVQRAAEAKADDSGVVDLALAAQADPQGAARAQATPLAKDGLFDDEPASVRPGPVSQAPISQAPASFGGAQLQQPMPSMPPAPASLPPASLAPASAPLSAPASAPVASLASGPALAQSEKKGGGKVIGLVLFGLVAASAVAAGGFFVYQGQQAKKAAALAAAQAAEAKPAAPVVAAAPEAKPEQPTAAAEPTPAPESTVDPNALPAAGKTAAAAPKAGAAKPGALALNTPAPAKPEAAAKLSEKDIPAAAAGPAGDLGNAMKSAVGADGKPAEQTPAAGSNGPQFAAGTVPQKPSQGAVTGAIGAVLPAARACLGPDDPISRATITFVSAGTVQSVNVTGGAAGKPAEACIKSALTRAKVAPFMEATYTAPITIRHN